jgi:hypothetical protein
VGTDRRGSAQRHQHRAQAHGSLPETFRVMFRLETEHGNHDRLTDYPQLRSPGSIQPEVR